MAGNNLIAILYDDATIVLAFEALRLLDDDSFVKRG
jgi:hypothetical protein